MVNIEKKDEPEYFTKAKKKVALPKIKDAWADDEINDIRFKLREDILKNEQNGVCAYCEQSITADKELSNIDHFRTRNLFPELTLEYDNLFVSCNGNGRCADYKDNYSIKSKGIYDEIINPVDDNPEDFFDFLSTGEILSNNKKAEKTIEVFNLNHTSLKEQRKGVIITLKGLKNMTLEEVLKVMPSFHLFIKKLYPKMNL